MIAQQSPKIAFDIEKVPVWIQTPCSAIERSRAGRLLRRGLFRAVRRNTWLGASTPKRLRRRLYDRDLVPRYAMEGHAPVRLEPDTLEFVVSMR